jgi:hypothetical protein
VCEARGWNGEDTQLRSFEVALLAHPIVCDFSSLPSKHAD